MVKNGNSPQSTGIGAGAIIWTGTLSIFDSEFANNIAGDAGGAISLANNPSPGGYLRLTRTYFANNFAPVGGAIYSTSSAGNNT
jgi:predicted outer membrane repeat protein